MIASRIVMRCQLAQSISCSPHFVFVPPVTSFAACVIISCVKIHHALVVGISLIKLQHRELRIPAPSRPSLRKLRLIS